VNFTAIPVQSQEELSAKHSQRHLSLVDVHLLIASIFQGCVDHDGRKKPRYSRRCEDDLAYQFKMNGGRLVMLSELGVVERSWAEPRQRARLDQREVIGFSIYRSVDTGEVAVTNAVRAKVATFAAEHLEVAIREVTSSTDDVLEGYSAAIEALLSGLTNAPSSTRSTIR
jgi:multidrug efflux pump subunit AcrB